MRWFAPRTQGCMLEDAAGSYPIERLEHIAPEHRAHVHMRGIFPLPHVSVVASASKHAPSPGRVSLWTPGSAATPPNPTPPYSSHPPPHWGWGLAIWGVWAPPPPRRPLGVPERAWGGLCRIGQPWQKGTNCRSWTFSLMVSLGAPGVGWGLGGGLSWPLGSVSAPTAIACAPYHIIAAYI